MKLIVLGLVLGAAAGFVRGGRLSGLSELKPRLAPLALLGLALQLVNPPRPWPIVMLLASFVLLAVFTLANLRITGFAVILVGVALNVTVIAINGGMPVSREAIVASGQEASLADLIERKGVKHHLAGPDDRLVFLGDVIPVPPPIRQVISVGDVFTWAGVGVVVASAMRRRPRVRAVAPVSEVPGVQV